MRRVSAQATMAVAGARTIVGVAPVLHFPPAAAAPREEQVAKNTRIAVELTKRFKGDLPSAYTRKHSLTAAQIEKEVEMLLGGAQKLRKPVADDQPMDKLSLMERCLRHGLWSYYKDEGSHEYEQIAKWLVYTEHDTTALAQLRRARDTKERLAAFRGRKAESGAPEACLPEANWEAEYKGAVDREVIAEKRFRYDNMAANSLARDDAKIEELNAAYRKPVQEKRLDDLCELLERFKPVLAREAIMQRLTVKHLEGELSVHRFLDWMPEVRDRAEIECDGRAWVWHIRHEENRRAAVRLRSKNELTEIMEKNQAATASSQETSVQASGSSAHSARDKLLAEVLALQARLKRGEEEGTKPSSAAKASE